MKDNTVSNQEYLSKVLYLRSIAQGLSMNKITEITGLSRPTVQKVLNGTGNPYISNFIQIAELLNCKLSILTSEQEEAMMNEFTSKELGK